ncbi:MAG: ABC transporter ATP-binding protein [Bacillota bacterium]|nr:ABC transporter ATP-binding protein [Bacillota bacterium]
MKQYLKNKYALSEEGIEDLMKSIFSGTLLNLSMMFPLMVSFLFIRQSFNRFFGLELNYPLRILHFVGLFLAISLVMYFFAVNDYKKTFTKIYDESARSRIKLAEKLRKLPLSYFGKKDIADLSATIMSDATTIEHLFSHTVPKIYAGINSVLIMAIMLFLFDYRLALALFWVLPFAYLSFALSKKKCKEVMKAGFDINREAIDEFQEGIHLVREIKAYNREAHFIEQINQKYDRDLSNKKQTELLLGSVMNVAFVILKLGMASVAVYGAKLLFEGSLDLFTYLGFLIISAVVFNPISSVMLNYAEMTYMDSIVERIVEINRMPSQEGEKSFEPEGYDIEFEGVKFSYDDETEVLENLSFVAKQGEVTALVGPSGSGKTTATKLAARFWDIQGGQIKLGGIDISKIDPETLLKHFSIVFQEVLLFNDSVMENIRLGRKDATDEEVMRVAKIARCDEFVKKLPEQYLTLIGENGEKLSGGERQRISIARALLKDAPVILLDESTASLDAENESKIQAGISELIRNKTVIIIAHRMRTVMDADKIVLIQDGRVAECGTSKELLEQNGVFAGMYRAQLGSGEGFERI